MITSMITSAMTTAMKSLEQFDKKAKETAGPSRGCLSAWCPFLDGD
jgi:hypothetical protein